MAAEHQAIVSRPASDVSSSVGLVGLITLFGWIMFCRHWPDMAALMGLPGPQNPLSGKLPALMGVALIGMTMVIWSLVVDQVHLRPTAGMDWDNPRTLKSVRPVSRVKLVGLWVTWAIIAALYCLGRWYWDGSYLFAMNVLALFIVPMMVLSIPYVHWLDRYAREQKDASWHFGAMIVRHEGWDKREVYKHCRAWLIKGFFTAFMLSILPYGFQHVVNADFSAIFANPAQLALFLIELLFVVDVQIGTVGYILTFRPLDAHIRSGNPLLSGWVAALLCYPPFVGVILGSNGMLNYENNTVGWSAVLAGQPALLWLWGAWLVALTAVYAWATMAFGIRFSNLTYRGVITHGPYKFTRHPAYLSKNLFWWCSVLPFIVSNGSMVDMVRNTAFLAAVSGIYYWRARTEEAHLLAEDEKYRQYHQWMAQNGLITAPLTAMGQKISAWLGKGAVPA